MVKMIALLKKKAGLTKEEFQNHYETIHVPLIANRQGDLLLEYRRNYIVRPLAGVHDGDADVDVVTECCYADQAGFDAAIALLTTPDFALKVHEDESRFLDTTAIRVYIVEVRD
jgi:uncharacterized protein (TIGR02118 family)